MVDQSRGAEDFELRMRELLEIEKMRNLEIAHFGDEVDEIHRTKDKRITELDVALWHEKRRADDLDRRWNELAREYEKTKVDLDRTGAELVRIQSQRSYRVLLKLTALLKGRSLRVLMQRLRARPKRES
ncbi:MAG TPA: hypothetical protein VNE42_00685 [Acidimicrobiales bacterium]|nr:hypothetical protein [Acidimicrobiales bacterium]